MPETILRSPADDSNYKTAPGALGACARLDEILGRGRRHGA